VGLSIVIRTGDLKGDNWGGRGGRIFSNDARVFQDSWRKGDPHPMPSINAGEDRRTWRWKKGGVATKIIRKPKKKKKKKEKENEKEKKKKRKKSEKKTAYMSLAAGIS